MDQVSRPLLIALAAVIVLSAFMLLRPQADKVADSATPVEAVDKANQASVASNAASGAVQSATGGAEAQPAAASAGSKPAPAKAAAPAGDEPAAAPMPTAADVKAAGRREAAVLRDIRADKVVVMLFYNSKGADDVATRAAVRDLDTRRGKVAVHVVPVAAVADFDAITAGVKINQSPTTLVIDRKRRTRAIVGLSEPRELQQAVSDALAGRVGA